MIIIVVEVLVSSVNEKDDINFLQRLNIETNAIIINQSNNNDFKEIVFRKKNIKIYDFDERGVGLSRNSALMRSSGEICVMADSDETFVSNYESIITNAFEDNPKAAMIVFNVRVHDKYGVRNTVLHNSRVRFFNALRYGTVCFAFRRGIVEKNRIFFSTEFGGGTKYGSGEDSLFIWDVLRKGLKVYSCSNTIADVYNFESSWFKGYDEKFFYDKGCLYKALSAKFFYVYIIRFLIKQRKKVCVKINIQEAFKLMVSGAKSY